MEKITLEEKSGINWTEYEGRKIEISKNGKDWHKRTLEKYNPKKENPFICNSIFSDSYFGFKYARLIEEKNSEIKNTNVYVLEYWQKKCLEKYNTKTNGEKKWQKLKCL